MHKNKKSTKEKKNSIFHLSHVLIKKNKVLRVNAPEKEPFIDASGPHQLPEINSKESNTGGAEINSGVQALYYQPFSSSDETKFFFYEGEKEVPSIINKKNKPLRHLPTDWVHAPTASLEKGGISYQCLPSERRNYFFSRSKTTLRELGFRESITENNALW